MSEVMDKTINSLEPNPVGGRVLRVGFFEQLSSYYEWLTSQGRTATLLPDSQNSLARFKAPEVIELPSIRAVGENGYLISADGGEGPGDIKPLDLNTLQLSVGSYRVYACLTTTKVPCGDLAEDPPGDGRQSPIRYQEFRRSKVVLAVNDDHVTHKDWIQVGSLSLDRSGGRLHTVLDNSFHPPVATMAAYQRSNPLTRMSSLLLAELNDEPDSDSVHRVRVELNILGNIANSASLELVFSQTQRCLGLLVGDGALTRSLQGKLLNYQYEPRTAGRFLAELDSALEGGNDQLYPQVLTLDGDPSSANDESIQYQRIGGEFTEDGDYWKWLPPHRGFHVNGMAILFPTARSGDLRAMVYGPREFLGAGDHSVARAAHDLSHPGVAMILARPGDPLKAVYISVEKETDRDKLRTWLRDGHAIYYW